MKVKEFHRQRIEARDDIENLQIDFLKRCEASGIIIKGDEINAQISVTSNNNPFNNGVGSRHIVCVPPGAELPDFKNFLKAIHRYESIMQRFGKPNFRSLKPKWFNNASINSQRPKMNVDKITFRLNQAYRYELKSLYEKKQEVEDTFYKNKNKFNYQKLIEVEESIRLYGQDYKTKEKVKSGFAVKIASSFLDKHGYRNSVTNTLYRVLLVPVSNDFTFTQAQKRRSKQCTKQLIPNQKKLKMNHTRCYLKSPLAFQLIDC